MVKNDRYTAIPMFSRHFNQDIGENQFFPSTLGTERTIQHVLALRRQKISLPLSLDPFPDGVSHDLNLALASARKSRPQFLLLMSLGEELKSHPSIVHGGFQCVILDQAFHHLIMLHHENIWRRWRGITHVAASMNTHHRAPLSTPGDILVRAWLVWRSHGAWFCRAEIVNSEGVVTTTASAKWVTLKPDAPSIVGMEELEAAEMEELKKTYSEELEAAAHAKELEAAAYAKTEELVAEDVKELEAAIKELKATAHANVKKLKAAIKELKDDIKARKPSIRPNPSKFHISITKFTMATSPPPATALVAIGNTPIVKRKRVIPPGHADAYLKLENLNPTGSYKDRMARSIIEEAERRGDLKPGMKVVEATGCSTGSSLAFVCAVKGYEFNVVSSDTFAPEKLRVMDAFGASLDIIPSPTKAMLQN
ncbi:hypothetical protein ACJ41O_012966 [Fusarium nematophilum]